MQTLKLNLSILFVPSIIIIVAFQLTAQQATLFNGQAGLKFDQIGLEQGLSQSTVNAIVQDNYGFMWFGTQDGLNRYNGYTIEVFRHNPKDTNSISNDRVNCLLSDSKGDLWIGTSSGVLDRFVISEENFYHHVFTEKASQTSSNNIINSLFEDTEGNIWIGTNQGLNLYNRATDSFTHFLFEENKTLSQSANSITAVCEDSDKIIWVGTSQGLFKFDPKDKTDFTKVTNINTKPETDYGDNVTALYIDNSGTLWVGTYDGVLKRYDKSTNSFDRYNIYTKAINTIYEYPEENLWIASVYSGLEYLNLKTMNSVAITNFGQNRVNTLYEAKDGILWIGTVFGGVFNYDPNKNRFKQYLVDPQNPNVVMAILVDQSSNLWVGTFGNGLKRFDVSREKVFTYKHNSQNPNSISSNNIFALCETSDRRIWIGSIGSGLNCFDKSTHTFLHYKQQFPVNENGLSNNDVTALYEDKSGNLWIGYVTGAIDVLDIKTNRFKHYNIEENNPNILGAERSVTSIREDEAGNIWAGTLSGLQRFDKEIKAFVNYSLNKQGNKEIITSESIQSFKFEGDSICWIGTTRNGLLKLKLITKEIKSYTVEDGLPNNFIYSILKDREGFLWMSTNKGITQFNPRTEQFRNYDKSDGLQANEFDQGAYFMSPEGEMFFGGVNGLNSFYPNEINDNQNIPQIYITDFKVFDKPFHLNGFISNIKKINLSYSQNFFSFEFVALNYTSPEKNQFAYKLDGFDKDWHKVSASQRYASYTNIDPGEYLLKVKGSNNDGIWNHDGTTLTIIITPPFWMTWWFRIIILIMIITLLTGAYKYRVNRLRELDRMRLRIASDLHDEVGSDLGGIALIGQRLKKLSDIPYAIDSGLLEINNAAFQTSEKLRDIVWFINPENDKSEHLINRLKDLASTLFRDIEYKFSVTEQVSFENADLEFRRQLYLIFKEILYNIVKHANAKKVHITLDKKNQQFKAIISDDGKGLPNEYEGTLSPESLAKLSYHTKGMGLKNIYRRSKIINASISIKSQKNSGTSIIFSAKIP